MPCLRGQGRRDLVSAPGAQTGGDPTAATDRQDVADRALFQLSTQPRVGAADLVTATQDAGTPASNARPITVVANCGFAANEVSAGTPAAAQRYGSVVHGFGR